MEETTTLKAVTFTMLDGSPMWELLPGRDMVWTKEGPINLEEVPEALSDPARWIEFTGWARQGDEGPKYRTTVRVFGRGVGDVSLVWDEEVED